MELKLIAFMCNGGVLRDFAEKNSVSLSTVQTHRANICAKFGSSNLAIQTHWAILTGLISLKDGDELDKLGDFHVQELSD